MYRDNGNQCGNYYVIWVIISGMGRDVGDEMDTILYGSYVGDSRKQNGTTI